MSNPPISTQQKFIIFSNARTAAQNWYGDKTKGNKDGHNIEGKYSGADEITQEVFLQCAKNAGIIDTNQALELFYETAGADQKLQAREMNKAFWAAKSGLPPELTAKQIAANKLLELAKYEQQQGFCADVWDGFKLMTGLGKSSNDIRSNLNQLYADAKAGKTISSEQLENANKSLDAFKSNQETGSVVVKVGLGVLTAPIGMAAGAAAGVGMVGIAATVVTDAAIGVGINALDAKSGNKDFTAEDAAKGMAIGVAAGTLFRGIAMGVGALWKKFTPTVAEEATTISASAPNNSAPTTSAGAPQLPNSAPAPTTPTGAPNLVGSPTALPNGAQLVQPATGGTSAVQPTQAVTTPSNIGQAQNVVNELTATGANATGNGVQPTSAPSSKAWSLSELCSTAISKLKSLKNLADDEKITIFSKNPNDPLDLNFKIIGKEEKEFINRFSEMFHFIPEEFEAMLKGNPKFAQMIADYSAGLADRSSATFKTINSIPNYVQILKTEGRDAVIKMLENNGFKAKILNNGQTQFTNPNCPFLVPRLSPANGNSPNSLVFELVLNDEVGRSATYFKFTEFGELSPAAHPKKNEIGITQTAHLFTNSFYETITGKALRNNYYQLVDLVLGKNHFRPSSAN